MRQAQHLQVSCFRYHKGTDFQANHNQVQKWLKDKVVVLDTTKVQIFKQITTAAIAATQPITLFQIPQRYRFSSKSQPQLIGSAGGGGCFRYHKGTDFQANHNAVEELADDPVVVLDTTKVQIFKQITTHTTMGVEVDMLFQIPQRYRFSSKSQPCQTDICASNRCFRYHKGTDFQANHNRPQNSFCLQSVVLDTTKVQIFKQITTPLCDRREKSQLFQIPQRYRFSSKSQLF